MSVKVPVLNKFTGTNVFIKLVAVGKIIAVVQ